MLLHAFPSMFVSSLREFPENCVYKQGGLNCFIEYLHRKSLTANLKAGMIVFTYNVHLPCPVCKTLLRDRPFNLQGRLWFFVSFRIFFSDNTRVRIYFFLSRKAQFFFPKFNIRLYDKNSESDYFFFPPPKSEYFFQQHWEPEYFFRKKTYQS
jgi:hypothetical protein